MTQPEALRLANSTHLAYRVGWQREAAAELRRLVAENERLAAEVANRNRRALAGDEAVAALANVHAHYECLEAQRDELLTALRSLLSYANVLEMRLLDADGEHRAMQQARAAIAKAEGEQA